MCGAGARGDRHSLGAPSAALGDLRAEGLKSQFSQGVGAGDRAWGSAGPSRAQLTASTGLRYSRRACSLLGRKISFSPWLKAVHRSDLGL